MGELTGRGKSVERNYRERKLSGSAVTLDQ